MPARNPAARRLLVVLQTPRDEHSAVFITYQAVARELASHGHELTILTPGDLPGMTRLTGRWTPLAYPALVARWLRRNRQRFDVVVFHSYAGWLAALSGATGGLRSIVAFHGLEPRYHEELRAESAKTRGLSWRYRALQETFMPFALRTACRRAHRVLCLNEAERADIVHRGWAPESSVATFAHGVPPSFLNGARADRPVRNVLFVGQWLPMKGVEYLAGAFTLLARRHRDLRLVCAGTLADEAAVVGAFDPAVRDRVTVHPRVARDALVECYRQADVFVFPSLYEGFGLAVLEAMASALPIVTTPVGVAADALRDGDSALLVPRRDPSGLAHAVGRLVDDAALRVRIGAAAHRAALGYREADRVRDLGRLLLGV